jgi:uncharacterized protein (TIGR02118 family)
MRQTQQLAREVLVMVVISVCYKQGVRLDEQYYLTTHVPLVDRVWGPQGLERTEVRKLTAAADGSAPPYQIIFSAYFPSAETLQAALQHPTSAEVMDDVKNYYDGAPEIFFGEVLA